VRVRTWRHVSGFSASAARQAHLDDLRLNFNTPYVSVADEDTEVVVDGATFDARRVPSGPYSLTVCDVGDVTLTVAIPSSLRMPRLATMASVDQLPVERPSVDG
jgi:hypothetical protein